MQSFLNKKYVIFPVIMIILVLINTFIGYHFGSISEVLNSYDVTGFTKIYLYIMFVLQFTFLVFCIYKGIKGLSEGYDYFFGKMICLVFVVLSIISTSSFFIARNGEEKQAEELEKNTETSIQSLVNSFSSNSSKKSNKKNSEQELQKYLDIQKQDEFYYRKEDILSEKKNENIFLKYFLFNRYNYNIIYKGYLTIEERYYSIYSRGTVINIICAGFYIISASKDERKNKKRKN